jgi:hypothetical protein
MHVPPQWANKHLLPPLIDNKRGEAKMTPHLAALVRRVAELYDVGLRACHCTEEFTLQWIALLTAGRSWCMSALDLSIQAAILLIVRS